MNEHQTLENQIKKIVGKSLRSLESAKNNFKQKDFETASSKSYYAVFHIMQAALLLKNLTYSKHSGVIGGFSKEFIKPGIFPKEFSRKIRSLFKDREISDYSYLATMDEAQAREDIGVAEEIIKAVESYICLKIDS